MTIGTKPESPFPGLELGRSVLALGSLLTVAANPAHLFASAGPPGTLLGTLNLFGLAGAGWGRMAAILGLALVTSGWRPRLTGLLHFWITWSIAGALRLPDGGDHVSSNLALILLPVTLLDGRRWALQQEPRFGPKAFAIVRGHALVAAGQVALIYLHAAVGKLDVTEWINGTALYYWMTSPMYGAPLEWQAAMAQIFGQPWISLLATWGVIVLEFLLAGIVFLAPAKRSRFLWPALAFHASIAIFLGLSSFFFAMAGALLLYCGFPSGFFQRSLISRRELRPTTSF